MGNGVPERSRFGTLRVNVDPLVIARGVGEQIDLCLGDVLIVRVPQVRSHEGFEFLDARDVRGHICLPRDSNVCDRSNSWRVRGSI